MKRTDGRHRQNGSPIEMHSWRTHLKRYNPDCSNLQSYSNLFLVACYATLHPTLLVCRLVSQLVSQLVGFDWPQMLPLPTHTLMGKRSCYIDYNFSWRHFLSVCRSVNCLPVHYDCPGMCECLGRGEVYAPVLMYVCCTGYEIKCLKELALCFPASICSKGKISNAANLL